MTTYDAGNDICLGFWKECYSDARWMDFPPNAKVLELGCAEADWQTPMLALRPDLQITGIDWRQIERPGTIIRGNILEHDFGAAAFDAIVAVSCIEWVGIGHYHDPGADQRDPVDEDGDRKAMARCARWLKPGGWMYLDVPHRPKEREGVGKLKLRAYSEQALQERVIQPYFRELRRQTFQPNHPDGPYVALLLKHKEAE